MFEQSLLDEQNATRKASSVLISFVIQMSLLTVVVILPMIYYESISGAALAGSLVAPPPPPPPPPPPAPAAVVKVKIVPKQFNANVLMAPKTIPKDIAMIKEEEMPAASGSGGVPGGIPGGVPGGVMGGLLNSIPGPPPPKKEDPPKPKPPAVPIRVGGNVQSAKLVRQPKPSYPPLARQARISGVVKFNAVIAKDGSIQNLTLVSGHPLLVQAATEAVRQWVYQPTLLNGEPVEVITTIDVNFTLSQ